MSIATLPMGNVANPTVTEGPSRGIEEVLLWGATTLLVALGIVMVVNSSYFYAAERFHDAYLFARKHLFAVGVGSIGMVIASRLPIPQLRHFVYPVLGLTVLALIAVLIPGIGSVHGGAQRWFDLGGIAIQPSEPAKLAIAGYLAHSLAKKGNAVQKFSTGFLPHLGVAGLVAGLLLLEPDYGTAVVVLVLTFAMLMASGARWLHLCCTGAVAAALGVWGILAAEYRLDRVAAFWRPESDPLATGYQLMQSFLAFGAGGWTGVGLGAGSQKMHYLPGAHTDFIFAVVGEDLGLMGTLAVVMLFAAVVVAGFRIARIHPDPFASRLAAAVTTLLIIEAVINMGVATGMLPTKGLALPFLSYGGSALVVSMGAMGLLIASAREIRRLPTGETVATFLRGEAERKQAAPRKGGRA